MDTVIQVLIGIVIILIAIVGVYTAASVTVDSAGEEVTDSSGLIQDCLSEGPGSDECSLFGSNDINGGG